MNKTKATLFSILSRILLASCSKGENSSKPSASLTPSVSPSTSTSVNKDTSKPNEDEPLHVDDRITLFRQGSLYKDGIRAIYAKTSGITGNIEWTSSNEDIIAIGSQPLNGSMPEVNLIASNYGKAVITAKSVNDPSIYSQMEVIVSDDFVTRSEERYKTISSSRKRTNAENYYSYDASYNKSSDGSSTSETIFEENEDGDDNLTDAFQFTAKESNGKTREKKYVRDGRFLATEYLDFRNEVRKEKVKNTKDDNNSRNWVQCPYFNYLGYASYVKASDFASFDNGKTYHFIGGYETAGQICLNFYQEDRTPDDRYFTVENGVVTSFHVVVDPYKGNISGDGDVKVKYGREITSVLSELGTATIEHLEKYPHLAYQDPISEALTTRAKSKNYTATITRKTAGSASEKVTYTYTEDTIDVVTYTGNEVLSHSGAHKVDDNTYYEYDHDDETNVTTITATHNSTFDGTDASGKEIYRYPTFDFAPEIFDKTDDDLTFKSRGESGQFISYCSYLPQTWTLLASYAGDGTITLDGNKHLSKATGTRSLNEKEYSLTIDYSDFGTSTVSIDFSKAVTPSLPTSFEEHNSSLAKERKKWNRYDAVPYLYYKPGYSDAVEKERNEDGTTACAYIRTNLSDTEGAATKFISDYKQLLVAKGYTLTSSKDSKGYDLYQKGEYKISVGNELNWKGETLNAAVIRVYSSLLTEPED